MRARLAMVLPAGANAANAARRHGGCQACFYGFFLFTKTMLAPHIILKLGNQT
jgi:hypothetical protein